MLLRFSLFIMVFRNLIIMYLDLVFFAFILPGTLLNSLEIHTRVCVCVHIQKTVDPYVFSNVFLFTLLCTVFPPWDYSSCMLDISPIIEAVLYFLVFFLFSFYYFNYSVFNFSKLLFCCIQ